MPLAYTIAARSRIGAALLAGAAGLIFGTLGLAAQTTLRIGAASDLQPVMPVLAQVYEKQTGIKLEVSFGSSSALTTQLLNGAPMDLFLAADLANPEKIVAAGLADGKAPVPYATGTLVLWTRNDSGIKPLSVDRLPDGLVTRIAIADEVHAPFGRAAYAALDVLKLRDRVKAKLVVAENVAQAAQFAESGNAQVAFVSLTLASTEHMRQVGNYTIVPRVYPPLKQCGIVLKSSPQPVESHRFLDWLTSPATQATLHRFGLEPIK